MKLFHFQCKGYIFRENGCFLVFVGSAFFKKVESRKVEKSSRFLTTRPKKSKSIFGDRLWTLVVSFTEISRKVVKVNYFRVWKLQKFSLILFWQKFRESNGFTKALKKKLLELIWQKNFQWERISRFLIKIPRSFNFFDFTTRCHCFWGKFNVFPSN